MNCSKARFLLSEYLDGEIQGAEREAVSEHLAECKDCALAFAALRNTSRLLAEAEVEPPIGLLAQIEAATINRPTFRQRLSTAVTYLTRVPASARWATASAVAAVALVFAVMSYPGGSHQIAGVPAVRPHAPTTSVVATQPATSPVKPAQPAAKLGSVTVAEASHDAVSSVRLTHHRHEVAITRTLVASRAPRKPAAHPKPRVMPIPNADVDTTNVAQSIPADQPATDNVTPAATPAPDAEKEIKIVRASNMPQPDWQKKEEDALADLRVKLAARNKQRRYQVQVEPDQGNKVSVDLASIRF